MAREALYTEQISGLTTVAQRSRLDALAETHRVSFGTILRQAVEAGLPFVEARYAAPLELVPEAPVAVND
jgi:hypothetical protein